MGSNNYNTINIDGQINTGTGSFEFSEQTIPENVGEYTVNVNRLGSTVGAIAFQYNMTSGQAIIGSDMLDASGQVSWADGESDTKEIILTILNDIDEEESENFTLTLSSIDNSNIGSNGEITFTIADDDQNTAPVVTLSENFEVNTGQRQSLTAQASDDENDTMTYLWEQTDGPDVTLTNADTLSASFTAPNNADSLIFKFTATDFRGASTEKSITISVVAPPVNTAPVVVLQGNFELNGGQTQNLEAQTSDAESDTMTYLWEQTAGSTVTLTNADTLIASFTAPNSVDSLTFKFTATDSKGASTEGSVTVSVIASAVTPTSTKSSGGSIFWLTFLSLSLLARKKIING